MKTNAEKTNQLTESLHPSLFSEKPFLSHYAEIAEKVRDEQRAAESIRSFVKRIRDKFLATANSLRMLSENSQSVKEELNKVRVEIQFKELDRPMTPPGSKEDLPAFVTALGDEIKKWSGVQHNLPNSKGAMKRVVKDLNVEQARIKLQQLLDGTAPLGDPQQQWTAICDRADSRMSMHEISLEQPEFDDREFLVFLLRTTERLSAILEDGTARLHDELESKVAPEWTNFVKGHVRQSRYEGHEFISAYGQYQDAVRNLNGFNRCHTPVEDDDSDDLESLSIGQGSGLKSIFSSTKAQDLKKMSQLKENLEEARTNLDRKTEAAFYRLNETEIEFETGTFPIHLLRTIEQLRRFFQVGMEACDTLFPQDVSLLLSQCLNKRQLEGQKELDSIIPVPPISAAPSIATSRANSMIIIDTPVVQTDDGLGLEVPKFAPPPPPPKNLQKMASAPEILPTPPHPPPPPKVAVTKASIEFPTVLGTRTTGVLQQICDPSMNLLQDLLLNEKSWIRNKWKRNNSDSYLPMPTDIAGSNVPGAFDCIQRCIQLVAESGRLDEWICQIWQIPDNNILMEDYSRLQNGEIDVVRELPKQQLQRALQYHILFYQAKHYIQKCVREVHTLVAKNPSDTPEEIHELLRKVWRAILGHRGLLSRSLKKVLNRSVLLVQKRSDDCDDKLDKQLVSMLLFYQLLFPALSSSSKLIKHWDSTASSSLRLSTAHTGECSSTSDDTMQAIVSLLSVSLGYVIDLPLNEEKYAIKSKEVTKVVQNVANEMLASFGDFFMIVSKISSEGNPIEHSPDLWMLEMWMQEWISLYLD